MNQDEYLEKYIDHILDITNTHLNGMDIIIPYRYLTQVIEYCNANNIPVSHVAEDVISVAPTYDALYLRESQR